MAIHHNRMLAEQTLRDFKELLSHRQVAGEDKQISQKRGCAWLYDRICWHGVHHFCGTHNIESGGGLAFASPPYHLSIIVVSVQPRTSSLPEIHSCGTTFRSQPLTVQGITGGLGRPTSRTCEAGCNRTSLSFAYRSDMTSKTSAGFACVLFVTTVCHQAWKLSIVWLPLPDPGYVIWMPDQNPANRNPSWPGSGSPSCTTFRVLRLAISSKYVVFKYSTAGQSLSRVPTMGTLSARSRRRG